MESQKKLSPDVIPQLRKLAHDLSNSIETVIQASYLLAQGKLDSKAKKWVGMIESAAADAARINRGIREVLRSQPSRSQISDKPRRRAS
jgi:hypothetical protein